MSKKRRVKLVSHTGSDIPLEEAEALGIEIIPDKVIFGDEEYKNMIEITVDEFYDRLKKSEQLPTSSQPSMGDYLEAFRKAALEADEILCLMITSEMSGCYKAAVSASQMIKRQGLEVPVYVYDTKQCSHGMAQMLRVAAEMANQDLSANEIMEKLSEMQHKIGVYFLLDSLENAKKGGRVGALTANTLNMLGLKPILEFSEGLVRESGIARNFTSGMNKIAEKYIKNGDREYPVTVFHADALDQALVLKNQILQQFSDAEIRIETVGPVIGIYTGCGCVGIAFTERDNL